ncbi:MAG: NUDIX hydrolase [Ardenticatenaceae bacterium]|nr:NUDIX hydrolase [Ardenticatenaceae bacterium]HBY93151.1 NUDIX hydrolase [Chloroflexota bacterium]
MKPRPWITLSSREVYRNPWLRLREDVARMPDGRTTIYGVCELPGGAGVLPFVDDERVIMVRQYRYVQRENHRWEMPTGGIHPGETPAEAAQRELREEIGYEAAELVSIHSFYSSKSVCDEICHLFIGRGLTRTVAIPDETEFLEIAIMPFAEVLQLVLSGEIRDAMTVIAVLLSARRCQGSEA